MERWQESLELVFCFAGERGLPDPSLISYLRSVGKPHSLTQAGLATLGAAGTIPTVTSVTGYVFAPHPKDVATLPQLAQGAS